MDRENLHSSRPQFGFTLLELLVVVFIIGVLATMLTLSVGVTGGDRELEREIDRLNALLRLASDEAVMQGQEIGLRFYPRLYEFSILDAEEESWVVLSDDELLAPRELSDDMMMELEIDGREVVLKDPVEKISIADDADKDDDTNSDKDEYRPQIFIFSSGDVTPFEFRLRRRFQNEGLHISVAADGTTELKQDEI